MKYLFLLLISFCLLSCGAKFDKEQWSTSTGADYYPYRESMVDDLLKNHKLTGLTYHQLVDSLGKAEVYSDDTLKVHYTIRVDYDIIDPVYNKYLQISLNKDSVVTGAEIKEWKKGGN